ncbi:alpha/beta hydrolase [Georgenia sp. MJ173]|uniref:alpha/beta hydrolase n=1 Tax=Georgenia sunbinii TaxID=3117728 RepID=UPI002F26A72D
MAFTSSDRRYEPYVRPIDPDVSRSAEGWRWRSWDLHVEHVGDPQAPTRFLLIHGAGGNAAAMWPFAAHLAGCGALVTVVDLPGYGRTRAHRRTTVTYDDWRAVLIHVAARIDDDRPLVLVGASMGGMLALETAAVSGLGDLVIATCLLDVADPGVRAASVRAPWMARAGARLSRFIAGPVRHAHLPLRWAAPMSTISNDPGLSAAVLRDPRGGGGTMPLAWFRSFLEAEPVVSPPDYAGPPVLLVHPGADRWTPTRLSTTYLSALAGRTRVVELPGCGHFPVEEPGFQLLLDTVAAEVVRLTS